MVETAIILAAGRGTKIWPYGDTWPKAALPVANRPMIQWQIEALQTCGVKHIIVVVGHLGAQIRQAVAGYIGVSCIEQKNPQGTADSLLCALTCVNDERFLVTYGDLLFTQEDLKALLELSQAKNGNAAMLQPLGSLGSHEWICASIQDQSVQSILGHPREASHRLCGVYALSKGIKPFLVNNPGLMTSVEVGAMPPAQSELEQSLSQWIEDGATVHALEARHLFADVDKPWHYLDANSAYLDYLSSNLKENRIAEGAHVDPDAQVDGYLVVEKGALIGRGVKIEGNLWVGKNSKVTGGAIVGGNTSIGSGTVVRDYCLVESNSSIGNQCVIGHAAEFGGILMDGAYSYHYGEYWGVIGRSSDLGAATVCGTLRFDDQRTSHRIKGRREIPASPSANASYLGDYTRTGVNAILMPGVKVGSYSVIGAGVILNEDVPNNSLIYVKQELGRSQWGPEKYGW